MITSVQDEMFIKFNHRAMQKKLDPTGSVMELNEDYECKYNTSAFLPHNNTDITPQESTNSLDALLQEILDEEQMDTSSSSSSNSSSSCLLYTSDAADDLLCVD